MKICRFLDHAGAVRTGRLLDDQHAAPVIDSEARPLRFASEPLRIARLAAPVQPSNIFAIGRNYRAHVAETGATAPERPLVFLKATSSLLPPGGAIMLPEAAPDEVDFEAELAIVIGRTASRVTPEGALEYVLGFTCANDVTARDCQRNDKQWTRAKGFDTFCPLGPWIVTPDELDPQRLAVRSRLNGAAMQDGSTADMTFSCSELISYLSHQFTLLENTVILTGTPDGVGFARKPPVFLRHGDAIEVDIEGIGVLTNSVRRFGDGE